MSAAESIGPEWVLGANNSDTPERERIALLDCAQRVWPNLRTFSRRVLAGEMSTPDKDCFSAEVWEDVLKSAAKVLTVPGRQPISNLEAYLAASFHYRLLRRAKQEKRLRERTRLLPAEELAEFEASGTHNSRTRIEDKLLVEQITRHMDEWALTVWNLLVYGMSWKEIGKAVGMEQQQAKQKFRYELKKIKARMASRSAK
jgi:DNA-directed RNA polymerase specialized sigma24 family protein